MEDDAATLLALQELFSDHGFRVAGAATVHDGMAASEGERPACAVLDVSFPGENVAPLARHLCSRHVPILFFTGSEDIAAPLEACPDAWVVAKPSTLDRLVSATEVLMRRNGDALSSPALLTGAHVIGVTSCGGETPHAPDRAVSAG